MGLVSARLHTVAHVSNLHFLFLGERYGRSGLSVYSMNTVGNGCYTVLVVPLLYKLYGICCLRCVIGCYTIITQTATVTVDLNGDLP